MKTSVERYIARIKLLHCMQDYSLMPEDFELSADIQSLNNRLAVREVFEMG